MRSIMHERDDERREAFINRRSLETIQGKLLQLSGSTLIITNNDGQMLFYTVAADATFSRDDRVCKAEDLKTGMLVRLTMDTTRNMATSIDETSSGTPTSNERK